MSNQVTREEAIKACKIILDSEDSFDPFMLYRHCLTTEQELAWKDSMIPLFLDFLTKLDRDQLVTRINNKYLHK